MSVITKEELRKQTEAEINKRIDLIINNALMDSEVGQNATIPFNAKYDCLYLDEKYMGLVAAKLKQAGYSIVENFNLKEIFIREPKGVK